MKAHHIRERSRCYAILRSGPKKHCRWFDAFKVSHSRVDLDRYRSRDPLPLCVNSPWFQADLGLPIMSQRLLIWGSGSAPCWRVMIALEEKGLQYESQLIEFSSSTQAIFVVTKQIEDRWYGNESVLIVLQRGIRQQRCWL